MVFPIFYVTLRRDENLNYDIGSAPGRGGRGADEGPGALLDGVARDRVG